MDDYLKFLKENTWTLRYVIDTHTHANHISGGVLVRERTDATYVRHKKAGSNHPTERLTDGSMLALGSLTSEAIETPGHTKDSLTLKLPGAILTGDWLFIGGAGRTDLPGGDPGEHWHSLQRVITADQNPIRDPAETSHGLNPSIGCNAYAKSNRTPGLDPEIRLLPSRRLTPTFERMSPSVIG